MKPSKFALWIALACLVTVNYSCSGCYNPSDPVATSYNKIIYTLGGSASSPGVYSMNTDGSGKTLIYPNGQVSSSPRGNFLLIAKLLPNDSTEYIMTDLAGKNEKKLFVINGINIYAILSPDAKYVAYNYYIFGSRYYLRLHKLDDNTDIAIGDTLTVNGHNVPVFSPDSKRLLYTSDDFTIRFMNVDGTGNSALVTNAYNMHSQAYSPQSFDWSLDASQICYDALGTGHIESLSFYDMLTGLTTSHKVDSLTALSVRISPKGTYTLYQTGGLLSYHGNQYFVSTPWLYNISTGEAKQLILPYPAAAHGIVDYTWSPDEKKLLLQSSGSNPDGSGFYSTIFSVDVASGNAIDLQMPNVGFCEIFWSLSLSQ